MHGSVLVVDDEEDIRELVRLRLASLGVEVMEAESGRDALDVQTDHPCDAILLDQRMPGMSGLAVARRLVAMGDTAAMAIYSAYLNPEVHREARERGLPCFAKSDWDAVVDWLGQVLPQ
jgi:CheY-like chemotaxis protein